MAQPTQRATAHRMRPGTHPAANVTSPTYDVAGFPEQADQDAEVQQWVFDTLKSTPPKRRVVEYADGSAGEDGDWQFELVISYLSLLMLKYLLDTFLPGGAQSGLVTVMTYTDTDTAIFVQCALIRPNLPGDGEAVYGGWRDVVLRFKKGTVVT
mgnify:CR=1 FL=1